MNKYRVRSTKYDGLAPGGSVFTSCFSFFHSENFVPQTCMAFLEARGIVKSYPVGGGVR